MNNVYKHQYEHSYQHSNKYLYEPSDKLEDEYLDYQYYEHSDRQ